MFVVRFSCTGCMIKEGDRLKIALAQLNLVVGDLVGNKEKILEYTETAKAKGCRLIVFPEMSITGYPARDLLTRRGFVKAAARALKELEKNVQGIAAVIGGIESVPHKQGQGRFLYSSAFYLDGQGGLDVWHKQQLSDNDLLDERRYFTPGTPTPLVELDGISIGLSIGEDLDLNLAKSQAEAGADLLINIGNFPYFFDQETVTQGALSHVARRAKRPVIWVNQVGANDETIFAGQSLVVDIDGNIAARARSFQEELLVVELHDGYWHGVMPPVTTNSITMLHDALVIGIRDYMRKSGFEDVMLGLSGGLDSAVAACLAVEALGPKRVHGIFLPSPYTPDDAEEHARRLAENLGLDFRIIPISDTLAGVKETLHDCFIDVPLDVVEENIQARLRGLFWMTLSNKYGWLLLNASNKSELATGYTTLYGDMCGSLAVLSDVYKSDVYRLADWINREKEVIPLATLTKAPSAELRPDQKDTDSLPPYSILDGILRLFIEEGKSKEEVEEAGYPKETIDYVLKMLIGTEYKRRQAAPGLRVSKRGFGMGWRMPLVASSSWLHTDTD